MDSVKRSFISEDWLSLWIGLFVFVLSLGFFVGFDMLGWGVKTNVWTNISNSTTTISKTYKSIPGILSLIITYVFLLIIIDVYAITTKLNLIFAAMFQTFYYNRFNGWVVQNKFI